MKNLSQVNIKSIQISLQQQRAVLFNILGQDELLEKFLPSLFGDKKILQEAYKLYCLISSEQQNQKSKIRSQLEQCFNNLYQLKQIFYAYESANKEQLSKCKKNLPAFLAYIQLKNYFEKEILEEVDQIPDELPYE